MGHTHNPALAEPAAAVARGRRPGHATPGRELLLQAALKQFAQRGFDGTSLRSLAAEAGVDAALVARLFGSKVALWTAVVDHLVARRTAHAPVLAQLVQQAKHDPHAAMVDLLQLMAQISHELPALSALLMHELRQPGERRVLLMRRLVGPFRRACRPVLAAAMAAGVLRAQRVDLVFGMLMSAIAWPLGAPMLVGGRELPTPALRDEVAGEAARLLLTPLPARP